MVFIVVFFCVNIVWKFGNSEGTVRAGSMMGQDLESMD